MDTLLSSSLLWLVMLCLAVWGCISISFTTLNRYRENPTVISMERDYKEWNTSLPTVTVCLTNIANKSAIAEYVKEIADVPDKKGLQEYLENVSRATYDNFKHIRPIDGDTISSETYLDLIINKFQAHIDFAGKVTNSYDAFEVANITRNINERGICHTYSTAVAVYNTYEYWVSESWKLVPPGILYHGNPLDGDRFFQWFFESSALVYVHSAYEIPDGAKRGYIVKEKSYKEVRVMALSIYSTNEVKSLSLKQRKCRFLRESNLQISPVYTYNTCRMQCRMKQAENLCGCRPYFYRKTGKWRVCDARGMQCLGRHEGQLIQLLNMTTKERLNCKCLPPCDDVNYILDVEEDHQWKEMSVIKWGMTKYPQMRLKRDILFGFTDLLVSIGGTAGLFLGCSVLSFMEILYFFTLRLFWFIVNRNNANETSCA